MRGYPSNAHPKDTSSEALSPYGSPHKESPKACGVPERLLLNISSPCSRLELLYEREETLIYVDLEDGVKVVCRDHLTCEAYDNYELLICEMLLKFNEKFIGY